jgi:hypothetical protein
VPAITEPVPLALVGPFDRRRHRLLDQTLAHWSGGRGNHEATVPILDEASPVLSFVRLPISPVFVCTNDQNSSIST